MKKLRLLLLLSITVLGVTPFYGTTFAQTQIFFINFQPRLELFKNLLTIIPGKWTDADWDSSHSLDVFTRDLARLNQNLDELQSVTDQAIENPEPSTKGKILSGLKSSSGQMEGLKKFVEKHLETPTAQEEVLSDLIAIEDFLDESAELLIADTKK